MSCGQYREIISVWLDGEANPEEVLAVQQHLDRCGDCRQWFDAASALTRQLCIRPAEAMGADETLTVAVLRAIRIDELPPPAR